MDEQQLQQQIVQLVLAALLGDQQATQLIQQIMLAAQQGDQQAVLIALMILQVAQQMQQQQVQAAKFGAKLNYIKQLKGQCPEGYKMEYYKEGGLLCKKCMKVHLDGGEVKSPKSVSEQFKMESAKCGKKMKKKENGGVVETEKCGGKPKLKKKSCGGSVERDKCGSKIEAQKCGGKPKLLKKANGGFITKNKEGGKNSKESRDSDSVIPRIFNLEKNAVRPSIRTTIKSGTEVPLKRIINYHYINNDPNDAWADTIYVNSSGKEVYGGKEYEKLKKVFESTPLLQDADLDYPPGMSLYFNPKMNPRDPKSLKKLNK